MSVAATSRPAITVTLSVRVIVVLLVSPLVIDRFARAGDAVPRANVGNALLVSRHHHLRAFPDGVTILTPCSARPARALLREDDLSGAAGPDRNRDASEHADHLVVGRVEVLVG